MLLRGKQNEHVCIQSRSSHQRQVLLIVVNTDVFKPKTLHATLIEKVIMLYKKMTNKLSRGEITSAGVPPYVLILYSCHF